MENPIKMDDLEVPLFLETSTLTFMNPDFFGGMRLLSPAARSNGRASSILPYRRWYQDGLKGTKWCGRMISWKGFFGKKWKLTNDQTNGRKIGPIWATKKKTQLLLSIESCLFSRNPNKGLLYSPHKRGVSSIHGDPFLSDCSSRRKAPATSSTKVLMASPAKALANWASARPNSIQPWPRLSWKEHDLEDHPS